MLYFTLYSVFFCSVLGSPFPCVIVILYIFGALLEEPEVWSLHYQRLLHCDRCAHDDKELEAGILFWNPPPPEVWLLALAGAWQSRGGVTTGRKWKHTWDDFSPRAASKQPGGFYKPFSLRVGGLWRTLEDPGRSLVNSVDPVRSERRCLGADAPAGEEGGGGEGGLSQQQARLG